jgi:hypothetical protein
VATDNIDQALTRLQQGINATVSSIARHQPDETRRSVENLADLADQFTKLALAHRILARIHEGLFDQDPA